MTRPNPDDVAALGPNDCATLRELDDIASDMYEGLAGPKLCAAAAELIRRLAGSGKEKS